MFCSKCGSKVKDEAKYCSKCGNRLKVDLLEQETLTVRTPQNKILIWDDTELNVKESDGTEMGYFDHEIYKNLHEECLKCSARKEDIIEECDDIKANAELLTYLSSVSGYVSITSVPQKSIININNNFPISSDYGRKIGFIDGGAIFKNGKSGILFFEYGVSARGTMDSTNISLTYNELCRGIIRNSGKFVVAQNKFAVENDRIPIIETTKKMNRILSDIRSTLLKSNQNAKSAFNYIYRGLIHKTEESAITGDFEGAALWLDIFNEYADSNVENGYRSSRKIKVILLMLGHDFENALKYLSETDSELRNYVEDEYVIYKEIRSRELYEEAKKKMAENDADAAVARIKNALELFDVLDYWNFYIEALEADIIKTYNSSEFTQYLIRTIILERYQDYIKLTSEINSDNQIQTLNTNKGRIENCRYIFHQWFKKERRRIQIQLSRGTADYYSLSISENDDKVTVYNRKFDEFGMTLFHYAALVKNAEQLKRILLNTPAFLSIDRSEKNVLGMSFSDLVAFISNDIDEYYSLVESMDIWYRERKSKYESNVQKLKSRFDHAVYVSMSQEKATVFKKVLMPYFKLSEIPIGVVRESMDDFRGKTLVYREQYEDVYDCLIELLDLSIDYIDDCVENYNNKHFTWRNIIYNYSIQEKKECNILLTSNATVDEFLNYDIYREMYDAKKKAFIENYISNHTAGKGEFETTKQYEERIGNISERAESEFQAIALSELQKGQTELYKSTQETNLCIDAAKTIIMFAITVSSREISKYNADEQIFEIGFNALGDSNMFAEAKVPVADAPFFKEQFNKGNVSYELVIKTAEKKEYEHSTDLDIYAEGFAYISDKKYELTFETVGIPFKL